MVFRILEDRRDVLAFIQQQFAGNGRMFLVGAYLDRQTHWNCAFQKSCRDCCLRRSTSRYALGQRKIAECIVIASNPRRRGRYALKLRYDETTDCLETDREVPQTAE